jgi:hypothetical protein
MKAKEFVADRPFSGRAENGRQPPHLKNSIESSEFTNQIVKEQSTPQGDQCRHPIRLRHQCCR